MSLPRLLQERCSGQHGVVLCVTAFFYLFFIPYFDNDPSRRHNLGNPNEISRVYAVRAMAEFGHLYLNEVLADWPERTVDCAGRPREPRDGPDAPAFLYYPAKSPGSVLWVVPFYYAYSKLRVGMGAKLTKFEAVYVCRLFGSLLPSIVLSYCIYLLLGAVSGRAYLVNACYLVYVLGTMAYPYSLMFVSHQLASAGLFVAFGLLAWRREAGWRKDASHLVAGFLIGLAVSAEYSALLTASSLGLYALARASEPHLGGGLAGWLRARRHLAAALAGAAFPMALTLLYNWSAFGSPSKTAYDFLVEPEFRTNMQTGWHGFVAPRFVAFAGSMWSPSNGLFFFSPFLLLALLGGWTAVRRRRWQLEAGVALLVFVEFSLYIACFVAWRGGWSVGPRYIANVVPFLVALALLGLDDLAQRRPALAQLALATLGGISITLVAPTAALFPHLPDQLANPFYEAVVPLLAHGFAPENLLGLPPAPALLIFHTALAAVLAYVLFGDLQAGRLRRFGTAAASLVLIAGFHVAAASRGGVSPKATREFLKGAREIYRLPPVFEDP